jgi:O-acetyl-ADP-ribose deacetylase (regulator of RNase III)
MDTKQVILELRTQKGMSQDELAVQTVKQYKEKTKSEIKVIFNVFKEEDERLYKQLLR